MDHPALQIAMRYVHLVSLACIVGGTVFSTICLGPVIRTLDDATREPLKQRIRGRFHRLFWICAAGLVVSGTYTWMQSAALYKDMGPKGNALIGSKVLLALILFAVVWAGSAGMIKEKACRMIALHLAAAIMLLAAILRHFRLDLA